MSHENDLFTTLDGLTSADEKVAHSLENLTISELETLLRHEGLSKKASNDVMQPDLRSAGANDKQEAVFAKAKPKKQQVLDHIKAASAEPTLEEKVASADQMGRHMAHDDFRRKDLIGSTDLEKVALGLTNLGSMATKVLANPMGRRAAIGAAAGGVTGAAAAPSGHRMSGALKGGAVGGAMGAASASPKAMGMAREGVDRAKSTAAATAFRMGQGK